MYFVMVVFFTTDITIQKKTKKKPLLVGLAYSFQRVKSIPFNRYDKKLDFVVTEKKIIE